MIYLFNSAYRPLYRANMLKTLFLPSGCVNNYRYNISGSIRHVPDNFRSSLTRIPRMEEVAIIFIDRFASHGYAYHTIRLAKYISSREEDPYLHITVELSDFIYPKSLETFNSVAARPLLDVGSARLTGEDPENTADGYYVVSAANIFTPGSDFVRGDAAWSQIVDSLSNTKAYSSTAEDRVVFARGKILEHDGRQLSPKWDGDNTKFRIVRDEQYQLDLTYRFPSQLADKSSVSSVQVDITDPFRLAAKSDIPIDSVSNSVRIPFASKKYPEEMGGDIALNFPKGTSGPSTSIPLVVVEESFFWPKVAAYIFLFSASSVIIGLDPAKLQSFTTTQFWNYIWVKLIAAAVQAVVLYRIAGLFGKKIL